MQQGLFPVDVICLSNMDGKLQPLRIRMTQEDSLVKIGNVSEILCTKENHRIGAESRSYLCRIQWEKGVAVLELKFYIRSLSWFITKPGS